MMILEWSFLYLLINLQSRDSLLIIFQLSFLCLKFTHKAKTRVNCVYNSPAKHRGSSGDL